MSLALRLSNIMGKVVGLELFMCSLAKVKVHKLAGFRKADADI